MPGAASGEQFPTIQGKQSHSWWAAVGNTGKIISLPHMPTPVRRPMLPLWPSCLGHGTALRGSHSGQKTQAEHSVIPCKILGTRKLREQKSRWKFIFSFIFIVDAIADVPVSSPLHVESVLKQWILCMLNRRSLDLILFFENTWGRMVWCARSGVFPASWPRISPETLPSETTQPPNLTSFCMSRG